MKLIDSTTLTDLLFEKFERMIEAEDEDDPLAQGEFDVIKELCVKMPDTAESKRKIDIIIDKCGPLPRGIGIQNLRESIIQTKWKYDVALEDKQAAYKVMIINFIERNWTLISIISHIENILKFK